MILHPGTQDRVIAEVTVGAGSTSKEGSVLSPAILASLWVNSISSGTLTVSVYTLTEPGKEDLLFTFPVVGVPSVNLRLEKSATTLQRFRVEAVYTGVCDYEVYVRATQSGGTQDVNILGQPIDVNVVNDIDVTVVPPSQWETSQQTVTAVAALLIPAAIADRKGILIKNWSMATDVFLGESLLAANTTSGYPLSARDAVALDISAGSAVYAVTASGTADIRIVQAGS